MTANPARAESAVPRLRVVQGKRLVRPTAWGWLIIAICAIAVFFGLIIANTALDRSAFELEEIRAEMTAEQQRFDRLRLDVAKLRSPERIQPLAEQLGLVYPDPADLRTVTAAGVVVMETNDGRWTEIKSILSASP
jgi:cell division protein FtsL